MSHASRSRAQSSPIGVVLILGLTLTAAVGMVVVGGDAIQGTQSRAEIGQAEQAMTQFDARAAQVALGDSGSQTVPLGGQSGSYRVEEDVGRVRLLHEDWNGTECGSCSDYSGSSNTMDNGNTTILYNQTLGAVVYESGGTTVAYQGGGVWRKNEDSAARPVSSPEFHYRDATLTFPLVRVEGSGGGSGQVKANVQRVETAKAIYPNHSETYPDGETGLLNPVQQGNMSVEITSEYCEGWKHYFEERTEGAVSECDGDTVTANIGALGLQGEFSPIDGGELPVRGYEDMIDFEITFSDDQGSESKFNNLGWSMAAENGSRSFEISVQGDATKVNESVEVIVYYSYNGTVYDGWVNDEDFVVQDTGDGVEVTVDFMSTENASWESLDGSSQLEQNSPDTLNTSRPSELSNSNESLANITTHYFELIGDADFTMDEQSNSGLGGGSTGNMEYEGGGNVVTYLHVTENRIKVELS